jgi:hypothetical protein
MGKFEAMIFNKNPFDEIAKKAWGIQDNIKIELALSNPRPAGLVLRATTPLKNKFPWHHLSDEDFKAEMLHNSGNFIAVLLRHPNFNEKKCFIALFDKCETEFSAARKRSKWFGLLSRKPKDSIDKVMGQLKPSMEELARNFSGWALKNRIEVYSVIYSIIEDQTSMNGNAMQDLESSNPNWFTPK